MCEAEGASLAPSELIEFARNLIADPAAVPRDLCILKEMPLTDVRKIAKTTLREHAAKRVFEERVAAVLPSNAGCTVSHVQDNRFGNVTVISISSLELSEQAEIRHAVESVMHRFPIQFSISFDRPSGHPARALL